MTTRKAQMATQKISADELLALIEQSDANGYPVYLTTAIACTDRRTVARLFDAGLIGYQELHFGVVVHLVQS